MIIIVRMARKTITIAILICKATPAAHVQFYIFQEASAQIHERLEIIIILFNIFGCLIFFFTNWAVEHWLEQIIVIIIIILKMIAIMLFRINPSQS